MHELGLRKCRDGPWVTEGAYAEHYATPKKILIPIEHNAVATIEESCDDTWSHVSVYTNKDKSPMDEPEWRTAQPSTSHRKRMSVKEGTSPKLTNLASHGDLSMTTSSNASLTQCRVEQLNKWAEERCQISATRLRTDTQQVEQRMQQHYQNICTQQILVNVTQAIKGLQDLHSKLMENN